MSFFSINKFKNNKINNYCFSFIIPIFLTFPYLFSYIFFTPSNAIALEQDIHRNTAVSIDEEIRGLEDAIRVANESEARDIVKNKDGDTVSPKITEENNDINSKSTIKVLMFGYHQVRETKSSDGPKTRAFITSPETFEKEMKFLSDNGYRTISTTDYINYLKTGKTDFNLNKSVILTFDDGYASQYTNALPILKKYGFTGTFFIYSDCIDKYPACMTSAEIKDLALNGMKIGNHTDHHAFLPKYNTDIVRNEIEINKQKIIDMVGTSSVENVFAYPYGGTDERVEEIVKSFNYEGAVGVMSSKRKQDKDLFNLKRYLLGEDYDYFLILFK